LTRHFAGSFFACSISSPLPEAGQLAVFSSLALALHVSAPRRFRARMLAGNRETSHYGAVDRQETEPMPSTASPGSAADERSPMPGMALLCRSEALPEGASRLFELQDTTLFAVRHQGRAYVYVNRCPHRHVPLHWQDGGFLDDSGSLIRCARHGALFLIEDGECVTGPCEGQRLQPVKCLEAAGGLWRATTASPATDDR